MMKIKEINLRRYLLLFGVILIIIGFVLAPYDQFKTDIKPKKVSFLSQNDGVTITGDLYLPEGFNPAQSYPAVILVHGINDRAARYQHMAVEFVRRNFTALAINLRGHDGSGGICSLSAYEPWDIMGAADYLLSHYNISNLGLVGHSLGGMSAIRAAHNDSRFNATVVMGPPVSVDLLLSRFLSNIDFIQEYQYLLSLHMNLSDPYERYIRSPIYWVNQTRPKNLFYVLGSIDTAATPEEALLLISNATGNASVQVNVPYGSFENSNRTLLKIYPGIDHGSEPTTPEIILDTVLWLENALLGAPQGNLTLADLIQWNPSTSYGIFLTVGFFICILPGISYICTNLLKPITLKKSTIASSLDLKKKILSLSLYFGIFIGASLVTFPLLNLLHYASWSPYNLAGFVVNVLTIQALTLLIGLILVVLLERHYYNATWVDFGSNKNTSLKAALIGVVISAFLIFGCFFLPEIPNFYFPLPRDWGAYILVFLNFVLVSVISEFYLRGLIQTKFAKEPSRIRNWINLLFIALIGGLIQGVSLMIVLIPLADVTITLGSFSINILVIGLLGGFAIFTVLGLLNSWIFQKTRHILPAAIVQGALISWFLISFMVML
jgi:pimeloyl-ACP methyl ester carboxylesterase